MAHILAIDDDADILHILTEVLTGDGHTVDTAENGKFGLKLTELNDYDLIITDMLMPEMDGIETIMAIRGKSRTTRIIVLTGGSAVIDKSYLLATAKAIKANKVLSKPIDLKELKATVNELLAS